MADLASLMRVAPLTAAGMIGGQAADDSYESQARAGHLKAIIAGLQQEQQQKGIMNPLLAAHQQLSNESLGAQIPGQQADSSLKQTTASTAQQTQVGKVQADNATNSGIVDDAHAKGAKQMAGVLGGAADWLDNVPSWDRHRQLSSHMEGNGFSLDRPQSAGLAASLRNIPADALPAELRRQQEALNKRSEQYMQHKYTADRQYDSHVKGAEIAADASKYTAEARIKVQEMKSAKLDKDVYQQVGAAHGDANKTAEIYIAAAYQADANGLFDKANEYRQAAQDARQRGAEDTRNRGDAKPSLNIPGITNLPANAGPTSNAPVGQMTVPEPMRNLPNPEGTDQDPLVNHLSGNRADLVQAANSMTNPQDRANMYKMLGIQVPQKGVASVGAPPASAALGQVKTVAQLRAMDPRYATKTDAELRAAYKARTGQDIQ